MLPSLCQLTKLQPGSGQLHPPFQTTDLIQSSAKAEDQLPLSPVFSGPGPEKRALFRLGSACLPLARACGARGSSASAPSPWAAPLPALGSALL